MAEERVNRTESTHPTGSSRPAGRSRPTGAPSIACDRRAFVGYFSALGLGGTLFPGARWARLQEQEEEEPTITSDMIADAEKLAGLEFTEEEREMMREGLDRNVRAYEALRELEIANEVPPALLFEPELPGVEVRADQSEPPLRLSSPRSGPTPAVDDDLEALAFEPVSVLAELIRTRQVSSEELTRMYLDRLTRYDDTLLFLVTLTEDRALRAARRADQEIARGNYRGPLHGVPWGAKDLLATRGHPTTWGAAPFRKQVVEDDATVVRRLDEAGAVLVAKLTLGALAMGDRWFGGRTRNPWNVEEGSSGSSAGPGAATAAGCVGFSIGTETRGSIVSPSTRNGGPPSAGSAGTAPWRCRGAWTRSARCAGAPRTVPWSSRPSTAPTAWTPRPARCPSTGIRTGGSRT